MAARFGALKSTPNGPEARMERFLRGRSALVKPGAPAEWFGALKSRTVAKPGIRMGWLPDLSAPNHSAGAPGFTRALLPLRNRSIRASGPFGVLKSLGLKRSKPPRHFRPISTPPWVLLYFLLFPNLFPKDQLRCYLFFSSCAPLPLPLSLFLFHLESLL